MVFYFNTDETFRNFHSLLKYFRLNREFYDLFYSRKMNIDDVNSLFSKIK